MKGALSLTAEQEDVIKQSVTMQIPLYNSDIQSLLYSDTVTLQQSIILNGVQTRLTRNKLDKLIYRRDKKLSGDDVRFIYLFLSLFNYTIQSFADSIGFSRIYLNNIMQGKLKVTDSFQERILNVLPNIISRVRIHKEPECIRYITDIKHIHTFAKLFNLSIKELALKLNVTKEYLGRVLLGLNPLSVSLHKKISDDFNGIAKELVKNDLYGNRNALEAVKLYITQLPTNEKLSDSFIKAFINGIDDNDKEELLKRIQESKKTIL